MIYKIEQTYSKTYTGYVNADSLDEVKNMISNCEVDFCSNDEEFLFAQSIIAPIPDENGNLPESESEFDDWDYDEVDGFNWERDN